MRSQTQVLKGWSFWPGWLSPDFLGVAFSSAGGSAFLFSGFWASWAGPTRWTTRDFTICRSQSRLEHPRAWRILRQFRESSLVVSLGDIWRWVHRDLPFPAFVGFKIFSTVRNNLENPLMKFQMTFLRQYFHVVKAKNVIFSKKWC